MASAKAGLGNVTGHLIFAKISYFGGGYIVMYENVERILGEVRCDDGGRRGPYCLGLCGMTEGNTLLGVRCFCPCGWDYPPGARRGGVSSNIFRLHQNRNILSTAPECDCDKVL